MLERRGFSIVAAVAAGLVLGCAGRPAPEPMAAPVVEVPAAAEPSAAPAPTAADGSAGALPPSASKTKLLCKDERPTGSNISQRVCRTIVEKQQAEEGARRDLQRMQGTQAGAAAEGR